MVQPIEPTATFTQNATYDTITYTVPPSLWLTGPVPPSSAVGDNGDMYLGNDGSIWNKVGGVWVNTGNNIRGPQGPTGAQGVAGPQGPVGGTGPTGATGPQGNPGPAGAQGPVGPQGLTGATGQPGPMGEVGPAGPQGAVGPQGPAGVAGPVGPVGPEGPAGPMGQQGAQGVQGIPGEQGPMGPQGEAGPPGPSGGTGQQGPMGESGPAGPQGIQGVDGPPGPQGQPGLGINLKGKVPSWDQLPSTGNQPNDAWIDQLTGHVWVWINGQWVDSGLIEGPVGPRGPEGAQGPTGSQGPQGIPGPAGPEGRQGTIGLQGPAGPQGARGPQGNPGDPYGAPMLAIGSIVHWRPAWDTYDRYGFCKPAVVLFVVNENANILSLAVLGTRGGVDPFQDEVETGYEAGEWHFIVDCPYSFSEPGSLNRPLAASARRNGHVTAQEIQHVRTVAAATN